MLAKKLGRVVARAATSIPSPKPLEEIAEHSGMLFRGVSRDEQWEIMADKSLRLFQGLSPDNLNEISFTKLGDKAADYLREGVGAGTHSADTGKGVVFGVNPKAVQAYERGQVAGEMRVGTSRSGDVVIPAGQWEWFGAPRGQSSAAGTLRRLPVDSELQNIRMEISQERRMGEVSDQLRNETNPRRKAILQRKYRGSANLANLARNSPPKVTPVFARNRPTGKALDMFAQDDVW